MNRREFLKTAGLGMLGAIGGALVAPHVKLPSVDDTPVEMVKEVATPKLPTNIIPNMPDEYDMGSRGYYWIQATTTSATNYHNGYITTSTVG